MLAIQAEDGEGSGNPSEPQPPPSTAQPTHEEPIPIIESSSHQKTQSPRQALPKATELPHTSKHIPIVPDEDVHQEKGDSVERATTTVTSLEAMQDNNGGPRRQETMVGASVQTRFERASKLSHDSPLGGGNTPRSDEDSITLQELTDFYTKLSDRVLALETDLRQTKKGRMIEEINQDVSVSLVTPTKVSSQEDQPKDQLGVLSAAKVLADAARVHTYSRRRRAVSTGSGGVSTASRIISTAEETVSTVGGSMPVSTAGKVQQVNIIIPLSRAIKDKENITSRVEADEELTQKVQAEERDKYSEVDQAKMLVNLINQRNNGKKDDDSQQQVKSSKKRSREDYDEESAKKQKLEDEVEKEELRAYLDIVPGDDVAMDVESLATKYPIVDSKTHILTENMMYYQIIRADGSSKNYKIFSEMLNDLDRQDMMDLHRLVKERVHVLLIDTGVAIHMLIEKKYPLIQEMLSKMLNRRLEVDHEKVIVNGDAPAVVSASTEGPIPPKTVEQKLARKNELKAKNTLLLVIPDEHLLKFHGIKDAKSL
ncbi:hypothetical protein Tco_0436282 [Tanacetum coccineum]